MANDFLVKVKETEQSAAASEEKALKKKHSDLAKYKQTLTKSHDEAIRHDKDAINSDLQKTKLEARKDYENELKAGENSAKTMQAEKMNLVEGLIGGAENRFLKLI